MKANAIAHGIEIEIDEQWSRMWPAEVEALQGFALKHEATGAILQIRGGSGSLPTPHTVDGLLALLRMQNWASAPFDVEAECENGRVLVAGTFVGPNGKWVREWYLANLDHVADACIVDAPERVRAFSSRCLEIVRSVRFPEGPLANRS